MRKLSYGEGDNIALAVGAIVFTVFALSLGDALIKQVSAAFPLWQVFVLRSAIAIPVLLLILKIGYPALSLVPRALGWTALRSVMLACMWIAYYAALPHIALSVAAAVYYTLPLFITLFAWAFAGERVSTQGWIAVVLGFGGVLLLLRPQADDFNAYALLPLISAVLYAVSMILTRTKCREESPLVLSFALNVAMLIMGALAGLALAALGLSGALLETGGFLLGAWNPMAPFDWLVMGCMAAAVLIGSIGAAIAYQAGPSSIVSTYDFAYLAFAALWGIVFFAEVPDMVSAAGIALIAAAGILAVRR